MIKQAAGELSFRTSGRGLFDITAEIDDWVSRQSIGDGLISIFIKHTSASLLIQENADPDVPRDLDSFFSKLVPEDPGLYRHRSEGPDDMPAHIRSALTQSQLTVPVTGGRLALGTWQGIYLFEHRSNPHTRLIALNLFGQ